MKQHGENVHELEHSLSTRHSQEKNSLWESYMLEGEAQRRAHVHEEAISKQSHAEEVATLEDRIRQTKKSREDEREYRLAKEKEYEEKMVALKQGAPAPACACQ